MWKAIWIFMLILSIPVVGHWGWTLLVMPVLVIVLVFLLLVIGMFTGQSQALGPYNWKRKSHHGNAHQHKKPGKKSV
jgi:uncharacterized membrane protein YhaH (DUF805 family)